MTMVRCRPLTDLFNINSNTARMWARCGDDRSTENRPGRQCNLDADVKETAQSYEVSVEMPGMEQKDIKVTVLENVLTLKGEKKRETGNEQSAYYARERCFGAFERSFTLPTNVQTDKVTAGYRDGILSILLPKVEQAQPRDVEIKAA